MAAPEGSTQPVEYSLPFLPAPELCSLLPDSIRRKCHRGLEPLRKGACSILLTATEGGAINQLFLSSALWISKSQLKGQRPDQIKGFHNQVLRWARKYENSSQDTIITE